MNSRREVVTIDWMRRTIEYPIGWTPDQVVEEIKEMYARGTINRLELEETIGWYLEKHEKPT
jgi:hypothetical protein